MPVISVTGAVDRKTAGSGWLQAKHTRPYLENN
jgi:hypothetical protein